MKISYNWLRNYLKGAAISGLSVPQIADILTDTGLEVDAVERIETIPGGLAGVVVGHVLTCVDHPDSDHLHVTTVDVAGAKNAAGEPLEGPLQIVCGAPNVAAGQKVLVATIGTTLHPKGAEDGFKIKKSKIRGVESMGMICAEDELGIGDSHDGIMVLPDDAVVGIPAAQHLDIQGDWMIEIGLTPNRIDGGSHYGVARDLAAYLKARGEDVELVRPSVEAFAVDDHDLEIPVQVLEPQAAPRYAGVTITGLKFGPSPEWLQAYLRTIGLNPHNNLVDITNFILHELGQPLHAFDADKIAGKRVIVKTFPDGTPFTTLDGVERKLSATDLMICDAEKPMCIAGVMGGQHSGVSETTTSIFLESACFDPVWIRKTARRHAINSDASFLFERGVDPDITIYALRRAALLYKELAGGRISSEVIDLYPSPIAPFRFEFSLTRANRLIGKQLSAVEVRGILAALEVVVEREETRAASPGAPGSSLENDTIFHVAVPPYRVDVQREADLVEEVLRIYGYNNVEIPAHILTPETHAPRVDRDRVQNAASEWLTAVGMTEIMSNSLTRAAYYEGLSTFPAARCVKILNPLSNDLNVMRQTLIFNALEAVARNTNHRNSDLKMYEFGNCYFYDESKRDTENSLAPYSEIYRLGITVTGLETQTSWNSRAEKSSFFTLSGAVSRLLARFGFELEKLAAETPENSDIFSDSIAYSLNGKPLLTMGVVAPKLLAMFDLKAPVYFAEFDFGLLAKAAAKQKIKAEELSRFPLVKRDLALLVDKDVTFRRLREIAFATERKLLRNVSLFDVYEGDKVPEGKKSYALGFTLENRDATLTDKEIERVMTNLINNYKSTAYAQIR